MGNVILRVIQNDGKSDDISIEEQGQEEALYNFLKQNNNNNATIVLIKNKGLLERIFNPLDKSFTDLKNRFTRAKIRAEAGEDTVDNLRNQIANKKDELSSVQTRIKGMPFFSWIRSFFITDPNYTSQSMLKNEIAVLEERLILINPKRPSDTKSGSISKTDADAPITDAERQEAETLPMVADNFKAQQPDSLSNQITDESVTKDIVPTSLSSAPSSETETAIKENVSLTPNNDLNHPCKSTSPEAKTMSTSEILPTSSSSEGDTKQRPSFLSDISKGHALKPRGSKQTVESKPAVTEKYQRPTTDAKRQEAETLPMVADNFKAQQPDSLSNQIIDESVTKDIVPTSLSLAPSSETATAIKENVSLTPNPEAKTMSTSEILPTSSLSGGDTKQRPSFLLDINKGYALKPRGSKQTVESKPAVTEKYQRPTKPTTIEPKKPLEVTIHSKNKLLINKIEDFLKSAANVTRLDTDSNKNQDTIKFQCEFKDDFVNLYVKFFADFKKHIEAENLPKLVEFSSYNNAYESVILDKLKNDEFEALQINVLAAKNQDMQKLKNKFNSDKKSITKEQFDKQVFTSAEFVKLFKFFPSELQEKFKNFEVGFKRSHQSSTLLFKMLNDNNILYVVDFDVANGFKVIMHQSSKDAVEELIRENFFYDDFKLIPVLNANLPKINITFTEEITEALKAACPNSRFRNGEGCIVELDFDAFESFLNKSEYDRNQFVSTNANLNESIQRLPVKIMLLCSESLETFLKKFTGESEKKLISENFISFKGKGYYIDLNFFEKITEPLAKELIQVLSEIPKAQFETNDEACNKTVKHIIKEILKRRLALGSGKIEGYVIKGLPVKGLPVKSTLTPELIKKFDDFYLHFQPIAQKLSPNQPKKNLISVETEAISVETEAIDTLFSDILTLELDNYKKWKKLEKNLKKTDLLSDKAFNELKDRANFTKEIISILTSNEAPESQATKIYQEVFKNKIHTTDGLVYSQIYETHSIDKQAFDDLKASITSKIEADKISPEFIKYKLFDEQLEVMIPKGKKINFTANFHYQLIEKLGEKNVEIADLDYIAYVNWKGLEPALISQKAFNELKTYAITISEIKKILQTHQDPERRAQEIYQTLFKAKNKSTIGGLGHIKLYGDLINNEEFEELKENIMKKIEDDKSPLQKFMDYLNSHEMQKLASKLSTANEGISVVFYKNIIKASSSDKGHRETVNNNIKNFIMALNSNPSPEALGLSNDLYNKIISDENFLSHYTDSEIKEILLKHNEPESRAQEIYETLFKDKNNSTLDNMVYTELYVGLINNEEFEELKENIKKKIEDDKSPIQKFISDETDADPVLDTTPIIEPERPKKPSFLDSIGNRKTLKRVSKTTEESQVKEVPYLMTAMEERRQGISPDDVKEQKNKVKEQKNKVDDESDDESNNKTKASERGKNFSHIISKIGKHPSSAVAPALVQQNQDTTGEAKEKKHEQKNAGPTTTKIPHLFLFKQLKPTNEAGNTIQKVFIDCTRPNTDIWYNFDTKLNELIKYNNENKVESYNFDSLADVIKEQIKETCESGYDSFELTEADKNFKPF